MPQDEHMRHPGRGGEIRTPDPLLPKQMRYQTALHPEKSAIILDRFPDPDRP